MPFKSLGLDASILKAVADQGYTEPTPIQKASIPVIIEGKDVIGVAQTGTGKTAAFTLPLLTRLVRTKNSTHQGRVRCLILAPTRELVVQIAENVAAYSRYAGATVATCYGGVSERPQIAALRRGCDFLIATPGRLLDLGGQGHGDFSAVEYLVLDEADRMLDMGFYGEIAAIAKLCPKKRQTLLFSATFPPEIGELSKRFMRQPQEVKLPELHAGDKIRQRFYQVAKDRRLEAVALLLNHYRPVSTLAFCNTRQQCRDLLQVLREQGFHALALHGELEQRERDQVLIQFANRSCSVLVATDVAARGLDIDKLEAVINVDVTPDPEVYIHRIGRTGRVDQDGWALSLASENQMKRVDAIAREIGTEVEWHALDELQPASRKPLLPPMATLQILGGRKEKIRPADVLGALTGEAGFNSAQVGKITITESTTYVAVDRSIAHEAQRRLSEGKVKGRTVKVRILAVDGEARPREYVPAVKRRDA